ncbi:MAG: methionyl aminopeptidase [Blautia sp.]|nr:methionyl aminopeptidase [Blautia sp.]
MALKIGRNDPCWCGSGLKYKKCHEAFDLKLERLRNQGVPLVDHSLLKSPLQVERIKESSRINIGILDYVQEKIRAGITTEEIDHWVHEYTISHGAVPAPLHFEGFPKSVCTSIDDVVCHGIPSKDVILKDGDIINVDVSTNYQGCFSDSSRMFCIGQVSPEKEKLVRVCKECVEIGIEHVKPWEPLGNMSHAIHEHAKKNGFSIVREIGGHGIGFAFHEDPWVGYTGEPGTGVLMVPGMMFTIEPMVNMGREDIVTDADDGWTVRTEDGLPSAQWEVTVYVTEEGCQVITW